MTLPIRVTWTAPMPTAAGMVRKTIYVLADEDRVIRCLKPAEEQAGESVVRPHQTLA